MSVRQPNPTEAAGILRNYLLERGLDLSHTQALEAVAQIHCWHPAVQHTQYVHNGPT